MRHYPFPPLWIGGDLLEYRSCDSTYCRFDYKSLPRLPAYQFDGSFSWLRQHRSPLEYDKRFLDGWGGKAGIESWKEHARVVEAELAVAAEDCGVEIPDSFSVFLFDFSLVTMLRSPTDCYFHFPKTLIPNRGAQGGYFIHFFSDSQNCYEWYLFLDPDGTHCVVASDDLSDPGLPDEFWDNQRQEIVLCAISFESFIYRLWIENEVWFRLVNQDQPLTEEMVQYLNSSLESKEV